MTLVILAAGMGSRYGGLKQIDPVTGDGEFIIDFSVYDAMINGFDKVVFVIYIVEPYYLSGSKCEEHSLWLILTVCADEPI